LQLPIIVHAVTTIVIKSTNFDFKEDQMENPTSLHSNNELTHASTYFAYHIKMYVETFLLLKNLPVPSTWDTKRNAILENHLVHARALINFLEARQSNKSRKALTDVHAEDYFDDPSPYHPLNNSFLGNRADEIGGLLLHIAKKGGLLKKSERDWYIGPIADELVPALRYFLLMVPDSKLADNVKTKSLIELDKIPPSNKSFIASETT
jgi:hypothetical protein